MGVILVAAFAAGISFINSKENIAPKQAWATVVPHRLILSEHTMLDKTMMSGFMQAQNEQVYPDLAEVILDATIKAAAEFEIPPVYLFALIAVESSYNYADVSSADCLGLMQVNPKVWVTDKDNKENLVQAGIVSKRADLFDPKKNIRAGAYILRHYIDKGISEGAANPMKYALERYFGGSNNHYAKVCQMLGAYHVWVASQQTASFSKTTKP